MSDYPLISIIIPCYNVEKTILETLNSALNQSYPNVEIIIVDDGSSDDLVKIIDPFLSVHTHIQVYQQENRGLPATRNAGFLKSKGDYLVFLDGDDLLDKTFLEQCYNEFEKDSSVSLVYSDVTLFEAEKGLLKLPKYSYQTLLTGNCIVATAMMRRDYFEEVGLYDENLKFTEDWELWIRYLYKYPNVVKVPKPLFFYRKRKTKDSMTDLNEIQNVSDYAHLYIYNKHFEIYREYGYTLYNLMWHIKYKRKHYNEWYRKLFYIIFKPKEYKKIIDDLYR